MSPFKYAIDCNYCFIDSTKQRTLLMPSINSYLEEIRKVFSNETYCQFKQVISDYRADHNVNKLLEKLERLFDILEPHNLFIFVGEFLQHLIYAYANVVV